MPNLEPDPPASPFWLASSARRVDLSRPRLLGILNTTPDSFHADSRPAGLEQSIALGLRLLDEGAVGVDVGGESTRPGAAPVTPREQIARTAPVLAELRRLRPDAILTIDTTSAIVAREALDAGADAINDTSAGRDDPEMLGLAADRACGLVLMHRLRRPALDRYSDRYEQPPMGADAVDGVEAFLIERTGAARRAGCARGAIVVDPGLGFGKSVEQNIELVRATPRFLALGFPVLSGLSRKSFVGRVGLGRESRPSERLAATLGASLWHAWLGARILRVHDVAAHAEALAWLEPGGPGGFSGLDAPTRERPPAT